MHVPMFGKSVRSFITFYTIATPFQVHGEKLTDTTERYKKLKGDKTACSLAKLEVFNLVISAASVTFGKVKFAESSFKFKLH